MRDIVGVSRTAAHYKFPSFPWFINMILFIIRSLTGETAKTFPVGYKSLNFFQRSCSRQSISCLLIGKLTKCTKSRECHKTGCIQALTPMCRSLVRHAIPPQKFAWRDKGSGAVRGDKLRSTIGGSFVVADWSVRQLFYNIQTSWTVRLVWQHLLQTSCCAFYNPRINPSCIKSGTLPPSYSSTSSILLCSGTFFFF